MDRSKRSFIPLVRNLMSSLFGILLQNNPDNINGNMTFCLIIKNIIHDLDMSLSILNITKMQISKTEGNHGSSYLY